jgi:hypothetical protein
MSNQEAFLLRLGDLSENIQNRIKEETKPYTVPIIINDTPLGSGTLVEIDGFRGVLTAEHVVRHPHRPDLHLDNLSHDGPKLLVSPAEFPGGKPIESFALRVFTTGRNNDAYGPDLAFIVLPDSPLLGELVARRSFYPLASDVESKASDALADNGFVCFCGYPASQQREGKPTLGYSAVTEIKGFAFITGPDNYYERNTWDYYELGITRAEVAEFGDSFAGVSGGGVWRVAVYRQNGEPPGSEHYERMTLGGVAFYEENHLPDGRFFVRTHGPKAVYKQFLPDLRAKLR